MRVALVNTGVCARSYCDGFVGNHSCPRTSHPKRKCEFRGGFKIFFYQESVFSLFAVDIFATLCKLQEIDFIWYCYKTRLDLVIKELFTIII